jgi:hypothetical protein
MKFPLILTIAFGSGLANAIQFDLPAGGDGQAVSTRCFSLYIGKDVLTTGKFTSTAPQGTTLNFDVNSSNYRLFENFLDR